MKIRIFTSYEIPIELPQYGLIVYGYWTIEADDDKVLVRKQDGKPIIDGSLCVEYRSWPNNEPLDQPYIEQPENYDDVLVEDYKKEHPEWIDPREESVDEPL